MNGETAPYDLQFLLRQTINTGGANAAWAFSPVYDNDNIKVRPIVGGRYFRIDETFLFEGASTLLAYSAGGGADSPANSKIWPPDTGIAAGTTATTTGTYTAVFPNATSNIVYSYINSQVVSNLSGPELRFPGRTEV